MLFTFPFGTSDQQWHFSNCKVRQWISCLSSYAEKPLHCNTVRRRSHTTETLTWVLNSLVVFHLSLQSVLPASNYLNENGWSGSGWCVKSIINALSIKRQRSHTQPMNERGANAHEAQKEGNRCFRFTYMNISKTYCVLSLPHTWSPICYCFSPTITKKGSGTRG